MEEEVAERTPLEQMMCDALAEAFCSWAEEEALAEQLCNAVRKGTAEALKGAIPFWSKKASKS